MGECCSTKKTEDKSEVEILRIETTDKVCGNCEAFVKKNLEKPYAIISCEGACLRGEVSRRVANFLCHQLAPGESVRICQGSALSKEGGQRSLVLHAPHLVFLEGCAVQCASRLFAGFEVRGQKQILFTDQVADFDQSLFGSDELGSCELARISEAAARILHEKIWGKS